MAKACPDNPRGLYPKGGGCRFCGSVEHLKSDCPRKMAKDERDEVKVNVIKAGDALEDLDQPAKKKAKMMKPKKKATVVF